MHEKKYHLITVGKIYNTLFSDTLSYANIIYLPKPGEIKESNFQRLFFRIINSQRLNRPFFKTWIRHTIHKWKINKGDTVVITGIALRNYYWSRDFVIQLKRMSCKIILLVLDTIENTSCDKKWQNEILDVAHLVDSVYTFDCRDAIHYNWIHTYGYYSKISNIQPIDDKTDVFCVMCNDGRLQTAVQIYDQLTSKGIKCSFYISFVSEEDAKRYARENIVFNQYLDYREILGRIMQTNVILEIVKGETSGNTLRPFEAAVYNKQLLTNSSSIFEFPYYNKKYMKTFETIEDVIKIDTAFFTSGETVDYGYDNRFSPLNLLKKIEDESNVNI